MSPEQSHELLAAVVSLTDQAPVEKVIRVYEALSHVMPVEEDRISCERIACCYREVQAFEQSHRAKKGKL